MHDGFMPNDCSSQCLPVTKLPRVAQRYRSLASTERNERAREDLLNRAEEYESRVIEHILSSQNRRKQAADADELMEV